MCWSGVVSALVGGLASKKGSDSVTVSTPAVSAAPSVSSVTSGKDVVSAQSSARKKAALLQGYQSTIKSGSSGDTSAATTGKKSLLGG